MHACIVDFVKTIIVEQHQYHILFAQHTNILCPVLRVYAPSKLLACMHVSTSKIMVLSYTKLPRYTPKLPTTCIHDSTFLLIQKWNDAHNMLAQTF